jgi:hypothetical protein
MSNMQFSDECKRLERVAAAVMVVVVVMVAVPTLVAAVAVVAQEVAAAAEARMTAWLWMRCWRARATFLNKWLLVVAVQAAVVAKDDIYTCPFSLVVLFLFLFLFFSFCVDHMCHCHSIISDTHPFL